MLAVTVIVVKLNFGPFWKFLLGDSPQVSVFGLVLWAIWSGAVGDLVWCCGQFYIALDLILNFITFVPSWRNN
jgi:hypothetical protein